MGHLEPVDLSMLNGQHIRFLEILQIREWYARSNFHYDRVWLSPNYLIRIFTGVSSGKKWEVGLKIVVDLLELGYLDADGRKFIAISSSGKRALEAFGSECPSLREVVGRLRDRYGYGWREAEETEAEIRALLLRQARHYLSITAESMRKDCDKSIGLRIYNRIRRALGILKHE